MKNFLGKMTAGVVVLAVTAACQGRGKATLAENRDEEMPSVEEILTRMRNDTSWVHRLDSMAVLHLGPGARCLDPVKHTFAYDDCNRALFHTVADLKPDLHLLRFVPFEARYHKATAFAMAGRQGARNCR